MYYTIKGKVCSVNNSVVASKDGKEYKKMEVVLENKDGEYAKHVSITIFGKKVDEIGTIREGQFVALDCDINARENNGRWYNDISAFRRHEDKAKVEEVEAETVASDFGEPTGKLPF